MGAPPTGLAAGEGRHQAAHLWHLHQQPPRRTIRAACRRGPSTGEGGHRSRDRGNPPRRGTRPDLGATSALTVFPTAEMGASRKRPSARIQDRAQQPPFREPASSSARRNPPPVAWPGSRRRSPPGGRLSP
ncbi:hypothetical protein ZWY2020_048899 [Hordeum vulgare]|nr:hypothetical protein ZWY2020_048899 [Hordeum vulgare]